MSENATYRHPDGRHLTTPMKQFILGDHYMRPVIGSGDEEAELLHVELQCRSCKGWLVIVLEYIKMSHFLTRSCPNCSRHGVLPDKLIPFVPPEHEVEYPRNQERA